MMYLISYLPWSVTEFTEVTEATEFTKATEVTEATEVTKVGGKRIDDVIYLVYIDIDRYIPFPFPLPNDLCVCDAR